MIHPAPECEGASVNDSFRGLQDRVDRQTPTSCKSVLTCSESHEAWGGNNPNTMFLNVTTARAGSLTTYLGVFQVPLNENIIWL